MNPAPQQPARVGAVPHGNARHGCAGDGNAGSSFTGLGGLAGLRDARTSFSLLACWLAVTAAWWALALAPVADPPAWLLVARSVCFGSTPSGLPDTYGWLMLTAGPATMLAAIVVAWRDEVVAGFASLSHTASGRVVLAAVAMFLVAGTAAAAMRVAGGLAIEQVRFDPADAGALPDNYPRLDLAVPSLALVDDEGHAFTNENLRGHVTLFTFAFAHCRTVCPAIMQTLRSTASRLGDNAPAIVVLTLDPWRDTPSRLPQMHEEWQMPPRVRVLSGETGAVTAALDGFHVPWQRNEATGDVVHPALVYAIDAEGRVAYGFNNPSVAWLTDAVARLAPDSRVAAAGG